MRQLQKGTPGKNPQGKFPKDVMAEGPVKKRLLPRPYTEQDIAYIKRRRAELIGGGKQDTEIGGILAGELGRTANAVTSKILRLVKQGRLDENPQTRKRFTDVEIDAIIQGRSELIKEGKTDAEISTSLAGGMDRTFGVIQNKIKDLVQSGELADNPNKKARVTDDEIKHIEKRRGELIAEGKADWAIGRALAGELGRPFDSVRTIIYFLVKKGKLRVNPNRQEGKKYTEEEVELIMVRRAELAREGKKDKEISRIISKEMGRTPGTVRGKIKQMLGARKLSKNPNRRKRITKDHIMLIEKRRTELIPDGKTDSEIAGALAKELGISYNSLANKIRLLVKEGKLGANPNKQGQFNIKELEIIKRRRQEMIAEGKKDTEIGRALAEEIGRSADAIKRKMARLVDSEELGENPNRRARRSVFSRKEIEEIKTRRRELLGDGKTDTEISRILAEDIGGRPKSILWIIQKLVRAEEIERNPGVTKGVYFTDRDIAKIKERREQLMAEGKKDSEISRILSKEMMGKWSASAIDTKIRALVRKKELRENPNKKQIESFSDDEINMIKMRREELSNEGLTDNAIFRILAKEMGRNQGSIAHVTHKCVRKGELGENPNKLGKELSVDEEKAAVQEVLDELEEFGKD